MIHCAETRNRIRLTLAAWAYEVHAVSLMSDDEFDRLALSIDVRKSTARPDLDEWFREHFSPHTGMWVLNHPECDRIEALYQSLSNPLRAEPVGPSLWEIILMKAIA